MGKRNIAAAFCVLCISVHSLYAAAVNMIICQEESDPSVVLPVRAVSQRLENAVIDYLFDNGHIVTNEDIATSETRNGSISAGLAVAQESYMDYYIVITAFYSAASTERTAAVSLESVEGVEVSIRKIRSDAIVYQERIVPVTKKGEKAAQAVDRFGKEIARKICQEIAASE